MQRKWQNCNKSDHAGRYFWFHHYFPSDKKILSCCFLFSPNQKKRRVWIRLSLQSTLNLEVTMAVNEIAKKRVYDRISEGKDGEAIARATFYLDKVLQNVHQDLFALFLSFQSKLFKRFQEKLMYGIRTVVFGWNNLIWHYANAFF